MLCLIFSSHQELFYVQRALSAGARGYIFKDHPQELAVAIRQVLQGGIYLSPQLQGRLVSVGGYPKRSVTPGTIA